MKSTIASIDKEAAVDNLDDLQKLRKFNGDPTRFWSIYLDLIVRWCQAEFGLIALRNSGEEPVTWRYLAFSPTGNRMGVAATTLKEKLPVLCMICAEDGSILYKGDTYSIVGIECGTDTTQQQCLALVYIETGNEFRVQESLSILKRINDIPENYQIRKTVATALMRQEYLMGVLDLMALLNEQERFLGAAMTLCNELAARYQCQHVSLGWYERGYVRVKSISHVDSFDKKMEVIEKLEMAMEESYDQNREITFPIDDDSAIITRDHEAYARVQGIAYVCTLPIRIDNNPIALCTLERMTKAFNESELRLLRLSCDQAARRLDDLKKNDLWFVKLVVLKIRNHLAGLVGFEHIWAKTLAVIISLVLCVVCFVPIPYRLESTAILRTDKVSFLTAPFDGHIEQATMHTGESVRANDELIGLDRSDLLLQATELNAEQVRYEREAEKAEAAGELADMLIARALANQAEARMAIVEYKLNKAMIISPFDGIIVEGDPTERIGSPVKQGDVLYKVARLEGLYTELEVKEREIYNGKNATKGELALACRPQEKQSITVDFIESAAVSKKEGNVFVVRCSIRGKIPEWWRPGMTGVAKLEAGRKTLLWIITHRTVDFLRMKLWW